MSKADVLSPGNWQSRAAAVVGLAAVAGLVAGYWPADVADAEIAAAGGAVDQITTAVIGYATDIRVVAGAAAIAAFYVLEVRDDGPSPTDVVERGGVVLQAAAVFAASYVVTTVALGGGLL